MIIRKSFKAESAHIVRNCSTERCKFSIHGHSTEIEVFLESFNLDNGGMVLDFGLMKREVKDFIDSFDHTYLLWDKESQDFKDFIKLNSDRWISLPVSPSAENLSLVMLFIIREIFKLYRFNNNEGVVKVISVRYHETKTGWAQAYPQDLQDSKLDIDNIIFSEAIKKDWISNWYESIKNKTSIILPTPLQQIK